MNTNSKKKKEIHFKITDELDLKLKAINDKSGKTTSETIRRLILNDYAITFGDGSKVIQTEELISNEKFDALADLIKTKFVITNDLIKNKFTSTDDLIKNKSTVIDKFIEKNNRNTNRILGLLYWANKMIANVFYFIFRFLFDKYNVSAEERKKFGNINDGLATEYFKKIRTVVDEKTRDDVNELIKYLEGNNN